MFLQRNDLSRDPPLIAQTLRTYLPATEAPMRGSEPSGPVAAYGYGYIEAITMPLHLLISVAISVAGMAFFFWLSLQDGEADLQACAEAGGETASRLDPERARAPAELT